MPGTGWSPRIVPYGADQTVYLVIDRFGGPNAAYRETEVERADLETIIVDLMSGQFNDPIRVVAFNTLEHWSEDVSEYIAFEIETRCDIEGVAVAEHIRDFVASHTGSVHRIVNNRTVRLPRLTHEKHLAGEQYCIGSNHSHVHG
jgi:hypothetical protein